MNHFKTAATALAVLVLPGCASIINETTQPVRFETLATAGGEEVKDMECKLENDYGSQTLKTPATVNVRRSSKDLQIVCTKEGVQDAKGVAISRVNGGMLGNIIFGGGVGAIIDHNKGTAYSYPAWVRLVVGTLTSFDRSDDKDGQPNVGREPAAAAKTASAAPEPSAAASAPAVR